MKDRTKRPLILQNKTIILETKAKQAEAARSFISSIADLKESPESLHTYIVTDLSLWNAACAGLNAEQVLYKLDLYSKYPVPKDLEEYICSILRRYGLVKLRPHPKSTLSSEEENNTSATSTSSSSPTPSTVIRRPAQVKPMSKRTSGTTVRRPSRASGSGSMLQATLDAQMTQVQARKEQIKSEQNEYDDRIRLDFSSAYISQQFALEPTLKQLMLPDENKHWAIHAKDRGIFKQRALQAGWPIEDLTGFIDGAPLPMKIRETTKSGSAFVLRDYQIEASQKWYREGLPSGGCGVVVLACGAGKTIVGLNCMSLVQQKTLILANNQTAVNQWIREILDKTDLTEDMVGAYSGETKLIRPVTVATYQIMTWRKSKNHQYAHIHLFDDEDWGLIIYDEVHLLPAPVFTRTASLQGRRRLGLTATLIREDGREGDVFSLVGPKVYELPWKHITQLAQVLCHEIRIPMPQEWIEKQEKIKQEKEEQKNKTVQIREIVYTGIEQNSVDNQTQNNSTKNNSSQNISKSESQALLVDVQKHRNSDQVVLMQRPTLEDIEENSISGDLNDNKNIAMVRQKIQQGSNKMHFHQEIASNPRKLEVVQALLKRHKEDYVLIIGTYIEQLKMISSVLGCPLIEGSTPNTLRDTIFSEFKSGKQKIIVVSKVANFAVDLPNANIAIQVSASFGSRQEEAQRIGRIMRPKAEGVEAHFYSVVTDHPDELEFAHKRQLFMTEQGYRYTIDDPQNILESSSQS